MPKIYSSIFLIILFQPKVNNMKKGLILEINKKEGRRDGEGRERKEGRKEGRKEEDAFISVFFECK